MGEKYPIMLYEGNYWTSLAFVLCNCRSFSLLEKRLATTSKAKTVFLLTTITVRMHLHSTITCHCFSNLFNVNRQGLMASSFPWFSLHIYCLQWFFDNCFDNDLLQFHIIPWYFSLSLDNGPRASRPKRLEKIRMLVIITLTQLAI